MFCAKIVIMRKIPSYLLSKNRTPTYKVVEEPDFNRSLFKLQRHASLLLDHVATHMRVNDRGLCLYLLDAGFDTQVAICPRGKSVEVYASIYWLTIASDKEIKAVFAHELGHLISGHLDLPKSWSGSIRQALLGRLSVFKDMFKVFSVLSLIGFFTRFAGIDGALSEVFKVAVTPFTIFSFIFFGFVAFSCCNIRKEESEADRVAHKFGFGEDLARDLYRDWQLLSWYQRFYSFMPFATHPPLLLRISRLKKVE